MKKSKNRNLLGFAVKIFIFVAIILAAYFSFVKVFHFTKGITSAESTSDSSLPKEEISITVPEGASTKEIAEILKENELIESEFMFRVKSRLNNYDGTFKHGTYTISKGLTFDELISSLQQGSVDLSQIKITIPEGYTAEQIGTLLEEKNITKSADFIAAVNSKDYDFDFIKDIGEREYLLEGYLFPDTYFFKEETDAKEVVRRLLLGFDQMLTDDLKQGVENSQYSLDEIITVASMVESEIKVPEERAVAAGVIYNRLKIDMPLQIDSTVQYALKNRNETVTLNDLEVDSPYNTYKNKGLPIGPISNPGKAAIEAAINPDLNNYLYYVVKPNSNGAHEYTETYDEFLEAKARYKEQN